jgi:two-component system LytT family response regulator
MMFTEVAALCSFIRRVRRERIIHRAALGELVGRLDSRRFVRVHRSAVVNIDSILHLEPTTHGEFDLVLRGGHRVHVSRTFLPLL